MVSDVVRTIVDLVKKIKSAVDTAKRNEEHCPRIKNLVVAVGKILERNEFTEEQTDTLRLLEDTLQKALSLIDKFQDESKLIRTYKSGGMSKDLQQVEQEISVRMQALQLHVSVHLQQDTDLSKRDREETRDAIKKFSVDLATLQRQQVQMQTSHIRDGSTNVVTRSASRSRDKEDGNKTSSAQRKRLATLVATAGLKQYSLLGDLGLKLESEIGFVATGTVYKHKIGDLEVAVKVFARVTDITKTDVLLTKLGDEIELLSTLEHKNIIKHLGCCYPNEDNDDNYNGDFYLVSKYMPNGNLESIIHGASGKKIKLASLVRIIQGIAEGVHYLHQQRVVHLHLKPRHILFDSEMTPKIIDFEKARALDDGVDEIPVDNELPGSSKYMAPEQKKGIASTKSDVFSFGLILLEALSCLCEEPQSDVVSEGDIYTGWINRVQQNDDWKNMFDATRVTGDYELMVANSFLFVAFRCCGHDPASRPSMSDVVKLLDFGSIITGETNNTDNKEVGRTTRSEPKGKTKQQVAITNKAKKPGYKIFTEAELGTRLEKEKESIAKKLSLEDRMGAVEALLRHFKWTPDTVIREWRSNREAVCNDVGLQLIDDKPMTLKQRHKSELCQKCNRGAPAGNKWSAGCGHYYCKPCWTKFISDSVQGMVYDHTWGVGPPRLSSFPRCAASGSRGCKAPVVQNLMDQVASKDDNGVYGLYLLKSYVEDSGGRRMRCPKGCGRAIETVESIDDDVAMDVVCGCNHAFCWSCCKEPHEKDSRECSGMV